MKNSITLITILLFASLASVNAQLININPDPKGEPWWVGGYELTPEEQAELDALPELTLTEASINTPLPSVVDNSTSKYFRSIFMQDGGSCGMASGVGYIFTYMINRERDLSASDSSNLYPTHFVYNYLNRGIDGGGNVFTGWQVIAGVGCPSVQTYGGMWLTFLDDPYFIKRRTVWKSGYDFYLSSLRNRVVTEARNVSVGTPEGLNLLKHWFNDLGEGNIQKGGGIVGFDAFMGGRLEYGLPYENGNEAGLQIVGNWGTTAPHAMTLVGYNDNIMYDFNNDGQFTNPEGDMANWEIGAVKVANSYGANWNDSGFVYMPYRLLARAVSEGGIFSNKVRILKVVGEHTPKVTMKVKINHPSRDKITLWSGVSDNPSAATPYPIRGVDPEDTSVYVNPHKNMQSYMAYNNKSGGNLPMQGINTDPIEIMLDATSLLDTIPGIFFLEVTEDNSFTPHNGEILEYSLVDYDTQDGVPIEIPYEAPLPIPIVNGVTLLPINYSYLPSVISIPTEVNHSFRLQKAINVVSGGVLTLGSESRFTIDSGKKIVFESGSVLEILPCGELELVDSEQIVFKEGAILKISPGAILNAHLGQSAFSIAQGVTIPDGYVNPLNVVPPTYHIAKDENATWSGSEYRMVRDLTVDYNAKLTLNNYTLRFDADCGITVAAGAQLSVLQTTLTSSEGCRGGATWKGINVEGNPLWPQEIVEKHGYLNLEQGASIVHAGVGVSLSNGNGTGGGVIQVNGATFTDNIIDISFDPYRYKSLPNLSFIKNSTYTTTAYLQQNELVPQAHVSLQGVSQVQILGNTFQNASPTSYNLNSRGFGVYASNSDVYIANYCERKPCDTGAPNTFSGLTVGVQSTGAGAVPALMVEKAEFSDCFTGVSVNGIASPIIQSCQFQVPDSWYNGSVASAITLNVASPFTLKANAITGTGGGGTGVNLYNLSQTAGSIEENSFSSLRYGVVADGMGKANLTCNSFERNATDVYLLGEGISRIQGSPKVSASNRFLTMCGDVNQHHILSPAVPITYYGYGFSTGYNPQCNMGNVYVFDAEALANCGGDNTGGIERMEAYSDTITVKQAELTELEDEGCTDNLMLAVENAVPGSNPVPLMRKLINASPALSDAVMVAATNRYEVLPDAFLTSVLASNPQAPKSPAVTEAMDLRPSPLPDYFIQAINESGNELSAIDMAKGNLEGLVGTRDKMLASMAGRMLNDTLIKATDTLTMAINLMPTATTIALKALLQFEKGEHAECMETLTVGMGQVSNSTEADELEGLSEFLAQVIQTDPSDNTYTDLLSDFAESSIVLVSLLAKNALLAASSTPIHAPFIEFDPNVVPRSSAAPASPTVSVTPEKATDYVVIKYNLFRVKPSEVQIAITDNNGINSWSYSPRVKAFEEIVVTEGWAAGNYTVNLSQDNKVIASTSFSIGATDEVTPFAENMEGKAFNISPNPAKSTVTISLTEKYASSSFSYVLLNSKGEPFKKGNSTGSVSVSIDRLMPAIYLVKVTVNGKEFTETLVKE